MNDLVLILGAAFGATQLARLSVPGRYRKLYKAAGAQYGVDPNLLHAIALKETRERAELVSPANTNGTRDYGLMQINQVNLARYGLTATSALDPARSIDAAAQLVRSIQRQAPQLGLLDTFSVYNAGFSDHDADPATPGRQLRPKFNADGSTYFNQDYVREAWTLYLLVLLGAAAPVPTSNWTT